MPLKDYSTKISVHTTIGEIQGLLAKARVKHLMTSFDDSGNPTAVTFMVPTRHGDQGFRLPANVDRVHLLLSQQHSTGQIDRRFSTREQAARVAWRVIRDWLAAQVALIEMEMVELETIMLPYLMVDRDHTMAELMEATHYQLPAALIDQLALPPGGEE